LINPGTLKAEFTGMNRMDRIHQKQKVFYDDFTKNHSPASGEDPQGLKELFGVLTGPLF
jgi:hypothetical protein